jgi:hypothetical protein
MTTRLKIYQQYPSIEKIFSEFIWHIFTGWLFLQKSFSSFEKTRGILISWKAQRDVMDGKLRENQRSTSHLLYSRSELPTNISLGYRGENMFFSVIFSSISIGWISSRDHGPIVFYSKQNRYVHSLIKLVIFDVFYISKRHLRAVANESQKLLISFHIISGWLKRFQR